MIEGSRDEVLVGCVQSSGAWGRISRSLAGVYDPSVIGVEAEQSDVIEAGSERGIDWLRSYGVLDDGRTAKVRREKHVWLAAGALEKGIARRNVDFFARTMIFLFFIDDVVDRWDGEDGGESERRYELLRTVSDALIGLGHDSMCESEVDGVESALVGMARSLGQEMAVRSRGDATRRAWMDWMDATVDEVRIRAAGAGAGFGALGCMQNRLRTVAMQVVAESLFCANGYALPSFDDADRGVRELFVANAAFVACVNDLISVPGDCRDGGARQGNVVVAEFDDLCGLGVGVEQSAGIAIERAVAGCERAIGVLGGNYRRSSKIPSLLPRALLDTARAAGDWHLRLSTRYADRDRQRGSDLRARP